MAATTLSSSSEGASGPLAPDVGSRATRSTELGHGLREAGDSGGVELGAAAASSWAVVALSSVARAELRPAVASLGDGVELRGRGAELEVAGMIWWMTVILSWTSI
jgi:hypothetical protein